MSSLPYEIKLTYIIAIAIMMLFVGFIVLVVLAYNRRQLINKQQSLLKEVEFQNQLLQKELERQKSIELERERISHDMHDDLGAGISAIKLQAEYLKQKLAGNETVQHDIDDLLKTSQDMNLSMREMLWSLNSNNDTLENFIQYISAYVENFLKKTNTSYTININDVVPDTVIIAPVRRNLFLCIKEAINNVYKYSKAAKIVISFNQNNKHFITDIIDDGIGITFNTSYGNGMNNMLRRMENCNGHFEIPPTAKGVHIQFTVPL